MDATGSWIVTATSPLGRLRFEVEVDERGDVTATHEGRRLEVEGLRLTPEGDGSRVRWTQQLLEPVRMRVSVDALLTGDRLTGTAKAGLLLPKSRLEGHRVG